ncbi:MAG: response regulator transcription factor [Verrucomicrobia subdivision 3 bacterium]|nr:response regulator transcription factor [Limisphaerales bacterium]
MQFTLRVLIAESSATVRKRIRALLEERGDVDGRWPIGKSQIPNPKSQIIEAADGAEAWVLFKVCKPQTVVLDLAMPDLNSVELLRQMKQRAPNCAVIVLSSSRESEIREECLRLGADAFLHKASEFMRLPAAVNLGFRTYGRVPGFAVPTNNAL